VITNAWLLPADPAIEAFETKQFRVFWLIAKCQLQLLVAHAASNRVRRFPKGALLVMPGYDRDQVAIDNTVENRQLGSIMLTIGWILLWMDSMLGIFFFSSLRDGSMFWPVWLTIEGVIGLVLIVMGTRYRHAIGATRLGQRDIARTARQERQAEAEKNQVA
jgi:hypothetical protein